MYRKLAICLFLFITLSNSNEVYAQSFQWAKSAGGNDTDYSNAVATDLWNNVYMAGNFQSISINFGGYSLSNIGGSSGTSDIFIAKYNSSGNVLWAKRLGGLKNEYLNMVKTDTFGNFYITGSFTSDTILFDTITVVNSSGNLGIQNLFFAKYDSSGHVIWAKSVGGTKESSANNISIDARGNVYITGSFVSPMITFGTTALSNSGDTSNTSDIFLAKYDSYGNEIWARSYGGTSDDWAYGITNDAFGCIYITGGFWSPYLPFGSDTLVNAGHWNMFLTKLDSAGNVLWARRAGGATGGDESNSVVTDANNNVYITGTFSSPNIVFGTDTLTNHGTFNVFIAKYDSYGNTKWAKCAIGNGWNGAACASADNLGGSVYITGWFSSWALIFDLDTLRLSGGTDAFAVKFDTSGSTTWAKSIGGSGQDSPGGIAVDREGSVYVTGFFDSPTLIVGTDTFHCTGGNDDVFMVKYGSISTSIPYDQTDNNIQLYPNPATNQINLKSNHGNINSIQIIDILGRQIFQFEPQNNSDNENSIQLPNLSNGVYYLRAISNTITECYPFVIKR